MIKEKELVTGGNIRFPNGTGINLQTIKAAISDELDKNGVPASFTSDTVKFGGLLNGSIEDCLVLSHPNHFSDYLRYVLRVKKQGNYAFLIIDNIGTSKMGAKIATADAARENRRGKSMSYKIGSMIGAAIAGSGKNRAKYEEEQNWYDMVNDSIKSACSIE